MYSNVYDNKFLNIKELIDKCEFEKAYNELKKNNPKGYIVTLKPSLRQRVYESKLNKYNYEKVESNLSR